MLTGSSQGLFTWSGGPRSSGVGFFCFHALGDTKQKKPTPLDRGPPLHVNRPLYPTGRLLLHTCILYPLFVSTQYITTITILFKKEVQTIRRRDSDCTKATNRLTKDFCKVHATTKLYLRMLKFLVESKHLQKNYKNVITFKIRIVLILESFFPRAKSSESLCKSCTCKGS